jgi:hypothetical protein
MMRRPALESDPCLSETHHTLLLSVPASTHVLRRRYGVLVQDHEALQAQLVAVQAQLEDSDARRCVGACMGG